MPDTTSVATVFDPSGAPMPIEPMRTPGPQRIEAGEAEHKRRPPRDSCPPSATTRGRLPPPPGPKPALQSIKPLVSAHRAPVEANYAIDIDAICQANSGKPCGGACKNGNSAGPSCHRQRAEHNPNSQEQLKSNTNGHLQSQDTHHMGVHQTYTGAQYHYRSRRRPVEKCGPCEPPTRRLDDVHEPTLCNAVH